MVFEEAIAYRKQYGDRAYNKFLKNQRVMNGMNTGTRTMKSRKDYSRAEGKAICAKY